MRGAARPWGGLVPADLPPGPAVRERPTVEPRGVDAMPTVPTDGPPHTSAELGEVGQTLLTIAAAILALALIGRMLGGRR